MCDDFDIKSLSWDFTPISKPTEAITKLLNKKKVEHNLLIECMRKKITRTNKEVDDKIKARSKILETTLSDIKEDVKMHFIDVKFKQENMDFEDNYLLKSLKKITKYHNREYYAVDEFCASLQDIEANRSVKLKEILRSTKLNAVEVAHELPFVLDEMFELEILELNKCAMSNYRHYAELEKDLKLKVKNDLRLWTGEIIIIKESIRDRLKTLAKKSAAFTEELMRDSTLQSKSLNLSHELQRFNSLKSEFNYPQFGEGNVPVSQDDVKRWLRDVQRTLAALDQSAKNIVGLYKSSITILFNRFLDELEEIKKALKRTGVCHSKEIEDFRCEIYTPSLEELNIEFCSQLEDIQHFWGSTITTMTDTINSTFTFLKSTAGLWDKHFSRVRRLQEIVLKDIEKTIQNNSCLTDAYESNLNITLEKMRQAITQKQLNKYLRTVQGILDKMETSYYNQSTIEINVLQKYKNMMEIQIDVLMSELNRFLITHPPDSDNDPKLQRGRASQTSLKEDKYSFLPMQILYCVFQVDAVKNWMFGLWEAINYYVSTGRNEIMYLADEWANVQIEKIQERLSMKLGFHRPRYELVKYSIYEKRLNEILIHSKQFNCQKEIAENRKKQLKAYKSIFDEDCKRRCVEYEEECQKIINELADMTSVYKLRGFSPTIQARLQHFEDNVKQVIDNYRLMCTEFVDELKTSNYKYVESLRLFSEGGNYSAAEAMSIQKRITRLEDKTIKKILAITNTIVASDQKYSLRLQAASGNMIANLNEYIREYEHNENMVRQINKFLEKLQKEVKSLNETFRKSKQKLYDISKEVKSNLGKVEYLPEFTSSFREYIDNILVMGDFMRHPEPVSLFSVTSGEEHKTKQSCLDMLLNRKINTSGNNFISILVNLLKKSFHELENYAKDFYKHHPKLLLDSTRLQPTVEDCMNEILQKYKPYLLQCEVCWMENVSAFIYLLNTIKTFRKNFLISFQNAFYRICIEGLNLAISDIWNQLKEKANSHNNGLKEIHSRLKVMFGHPRNNKILKELELDYKEINEDYQQKFSNVIPPHKEYLSKVYELLIAELEKVLPSLSDLESDNGIEDLTNSLVEQLKIKTQLMCPNVKEAEDSVPESQIPLIKDMNKYMENYICLSLSELKLEATSLETQTLETLSSQKTFENADDFLSVLQEKIVSTGAEIETFVRDKLIKAGEDFKESWAEDIKYILNLYKVKYDNKI